MCLLILFSIFSVWKCIVWENSGAALTVAAAEDGAKCGHEFRSADAIKRHTWHSYRLHHLSYQFYAPHILL